MSLLYFLLVDGLSCLVGERGECCWAPVCVACGCCDFCMAHHADSGVFAGSDLCELCTEEMACGSHCCVGQSCRVEGLFPPSAFFDAVEWFVVEGEDELVRFNFVLLDSFV